MRSSLLTIPIGAIALASLAPAQTRIQELCAQDPGTNHGRAVSFHGSLDGQGRAIVVIGAPNSRLFTGGVHTVPGAVRFSDLSPAWIGTQDGAEFGASLVAALRLQGAPNEAADDVVVGAPGFDTATMDAGRVQAFGPGGVVLWTLDGGSAEGRAGASLALAGDIDGDGFDDVLVGAPSGAGAGPGQVILVSGASGIPIRDHAGTATGDRFGAGVCGLGDVDGDLVPDYAAGAPFALGGLGEIIVFSGSTGAVLQTITGPAVNAEFGAALAGGQDLDRDGNLDLVVGAPGFENDRGRAFAFEPISGTSLVTVTGAETAGRFGTSLALSRDFDGNGAGDIVVGAPSRVLNGQPQRGGTVTVFSGVDGALLARVGGGFHGAGAGAAVASGADQDGDGLDDVLVGGYENTDGYGHNGCVAVIGIGVDRVASVGDLDSGHGASVAWADDIDGDGAPDLLIGAPNGNDGRGEVRVETVDGALLGTVQGVAMNEHLGLAATSLGDLNGDGTPDFACGGAGIVRVHSGAPGFPEIWIVTGVSPNFGGALAGGGDVDGDGIGDLIAGVDPNCSLRGEVRVLSGATGATIHALTSPAACEGFGASVAIVDDMDGDGRDEFAFGVRDHRPGAPTFFTGELRLMNGSDGSIRGTFATFDLRIGTSLATVDDLDGDGFRDLVTSWWETQSLLTFGGVHAVSTATMQSLWSVEQRNFYQGVSYGYAIDSSRGDFNGDGIDDVVVGNPGKNSPGMRAAGSAVVLSGTDGTELLGVDGYSGWDYFGYSVAGLGDVDGDGIADVAVGAPTERSNSQGATPGANRVEIIRSNGLVAHSHCSFSRNSTGRRARINAAGGSSISAAGLTLAVTDAPAGQFAMIVYGDAAPSTPFFSGLNCVGPAWLRLTSALQLSPAGALEFQVDFAAPSATFLSPGSTWSFQAWFRDPLLGVSTTDAVRVTLRP